MASLCSILSSLVLCIILAISSSQATDSEIVEAGPPNVTGLGEPEETLWNSNGSMQVQPYNILEASCPEGSQQALSQARLVLGIVNKLAENPDI